MQTTARGINQQAVLIRKMKGNTKMKILVIFTGGTIGSTVSDGWITPDDSTRYTLINIYKQKYGDEVVFVTRAPYTILSENLSASTLMALVHEVHSAVEEQFDGIIVTHGTDTLQFSAAALAYATGNNCIPVVLVSSNYPLDDPRANGNANFKAAVDFIKNGCGRGVFVAYKNNEDVVTFHNALATLDHLEANDAVFSMYGNVYAKKTENGIRVIGRALPCEKLPIKFDEDPRILTIKLHPADRYAYTLTNYRAVILRPYHSGTLNTDSSSFVAFCERAKAQGIPVYAVNIPRGTTYVSSKTFDALGITPLYETTFAAAYVKLWMDLSK